MNKRLSNLWITLGHYKYLIVVVLGVAIVGFVDENSFLRRAQLQIRINNLQSEIEHYRELNDKDTRQLEELQRNPRAIERIAREQYFMKADDEDIFVLSDEMSDEMKQQEQKQKDEATE